MSHPDRPLRQADGPATLTPINKYLARRGLRLTMFGELIGPTLGLMVIVAVAWAFIWIVA